MEVFRPQNVYADLSSVSIVLAQEYETFWGRRTSTGCPQPKDYSKEALETENILDVPHKNRSYSSGYGPLTKDRIPSYFFNHNAFRLGVGA